MATRWGIVSAGKISSDFASGLKLLPENEHQIVAVAARNLDHAKAFAEKFGISKYHGSYEELAINKDIDIAYIGTIHTHHLPLCKLFINAGINVLCEKPMAMNTREARQIFDLARKKNVFFMEGFWSRFFPVYEDLRQSIQSGDIGTPQFVQAALGDNLTAAPNVERITVKELGGGSLLDMGCYPIQFAQMVFNDEKPVKITANGFFNEGGADDMVTATLTYSDNRMAIVSSSTKCSLDQSAVVCGSKQENNIIKVENFWNPEKLVTPTKTFHHPLPKSKYPLNYRRSEGLMYEAQAVREAIQKGLKEHPLMTWQMSLNIQEIMDEIRRQIGLTYAQDEKALPPGLI